MHFIDWKKAAVKQRFARLRKILAKHFIRRWQTTMEFPTIYWYLDKLLKSMCVKICEHARIRIWVYTIFFLWFPLLFQFFDKLHQGDTSFVLKFAYGCETCHNVRLLKVRNSLLAQLHAVLTEQNTDIQLAYLIRSRCMITVFLFSSDYYAEDARS